MMEGIDTLVLEKVHWRGILAGTKNTDRDTKNRGEREAPL